MKTNALGHNNARINRQTDLRLAVVALLRMDDQYYADLQYSMGILYLKTYLEGDEHYADLLSRSKIFWSWWKNHWAMRDEAFLALHKQVYISNTEIRTKIYEEYHNGKMLADCIHPNSVVLNETYAEMIQFLVKGETIAI